MWVGHSGGCGNGPILEALAITGVEILHALWAGTQTVQCMQGHGQVVGQLVAEFRRLSQVGVEKRVQVGLCSGVCGWVQIHGQGLQS